MLEISTLFSNWKLKLIFFSLFVVLILFRAFFLTALVSNWLTTTYLAAEFKCCIHADRQHHSFNKKERQQPSHDCAAAITSLLASGSLLTGCVSPNLFSLRTRARERERQIQTCMLCWAAVIHIFLFRPVLMSMPFLWTVDSWWWAWGPVLLPTCWLTLYYISPWHMLLVILYVNFGSDKRGKPTLLVVYDFL